MEPAMSVPWPMVPRPAAVAEAAPPDEPPGVSLGKAGFFVAPCRELRVNQRREKAGVLVRPTMIAPARRRLATGGLSSVAMRLDWMRSPLVVAKPAWSMLTYTVTGTPARGPGSSPRAICASMSRAAARA